MMRVLAACVLGFTAVCSLPGAAFAQSQAARGVIDKPADIPFKAADRTEEFFPDTPANRKLVDQAYREYQALRQSHGHVIEVNGVAMHFLEWGAKDGVPLIWAPGYGSTAFEMAPVGQKLADAGYHVFSISYRGHGETRVTNYEFSLADIADDIALMMDKLGYRQAVIGGLSLGGAVATTFYENYPDRVLGLVLEDGGADPVQQRLERMFAASPEAARLSRGAPPDPQFPDRFSAFSWYADLYGPAWRGLPEGTPIILQSMIGPNGTGGFTTNQDSAKLLGIGLSAGNPAESYKLPLLAQSWRRVNPIITFRNLKVPVVIIDPTGDAFDPGPAYRDLKARHPRQIELIEYPDTPHPAHPMRPDWFVRDLKVLLSKVRAARDLGPGASK